MFKGDMNKKRAKALQKVKDAAIRVAAAGKPSSVRGSPATMLVWQKRYARQALSCWSRTTLRWHWRVAIKE